MLGESRGFALKRLRSPDPRAKPERYDFFQGRRRKKHCLTPALSLRRKEAYKPFVIEIGNEQPLSMEFVKKAAAERSLVSCAWVQGLGFEGETQLVPQG